MEQPSYSQRILDLDPDDSLYIGMPEENSGYQEGCKQTRQAAAEIAKEADARIKELESKLAEARSTLQRLTGLTGIC